MATLKTNFAGIEMLNPFMLASAPPTTNPECIARAFDAGWGGAVIKTVQYTPRWTKMNVTPRIRAYKDKNSILGFTNFEIGSPKSLDQWAEGVRWLKERYPEHVVFGSLMHTDVLDEDEWKKTAIILEQAGVDGLELNVSCSHGQAESGCGAALGADDQKIEMIVSWIKSVTNTVVMPKLTALTMDIKSKGFAAKQGGADALTAINTLSSLSGIDLNTFIPYNSVNGMSAFQGLSGKAIKPIALRCVAQLAESVDLPISATGGIYTWQDAAEFTLLGAGTLQVCSAVMENGYSIIDNLTTGLLNYMDNKGFETLSDFRGKSLEHITAQIQLDRNIKLRADVDTAKCIGCSKCVKVCSSNGYKAIELLDGLARVDRNKCDGCGLCSQICIKNCIAMN